jgi:hypothetical protein
MENINTDKKMYCTELSATPIETGNQEKSAIKKIWQRWGLGYEAIYYQINESWIKAIQNNEKTEEIEKIFSGELHDNWTRAVISLTNELLNHLTKSGEHQEINNLHWIDLTDFNDWFSEVERETGINGRKLPKITPSEFAIESDEFAKMMDQDESSSLND